MVNVENFIHIRGMRLIFFFFGHFAVHLFRVPHRSGYMSVAIGQSGILIFAIVGVIVVVATVRDLS